jgi:hypothetical protein
MPNFLTLVLVCLLVGATAAQAGEKQSPAPGAPSPEDLKVVAMMETLQLMDLAQEMDMVKDINYLIEDDQNENHTD